MDSLPIVLPSPPSPPRRPPLPLVAALVPIAAGVVLWLVSGSLYALCFAALGPMMLVASLWDGARTRRRDRRQEQADVAAGWAAAETELIRRHDEERARQWQRHPDAAAALTQTPLRGVGAPDDTTEVVVGSGAVAMSLRAGGGEGERARDFQRRCGTLLRAPVRVPLGRGICLRGPAPQVSAVGRALVAQLCLRYGPGHLAVVGEGVERLAVSGFPHAERPQEASFRLGVCAASGSDRGADATIWLMTADAEIPDGITTVIDVVELGSAVVRTPQGSADVAVEALSADQITQIAVGVGDHRSAMSRVPERVALVDVAQRRGVNGLPAVIGRSADGDVVVDIVEDGPHAIVTGITGTGKSELLVSWVTALSQEHGPDRVTFVLADFKGGTAFEPLRALRQVAAVITDLDEHGARRGVASLTAEIRRREARLAAAGVRDSADIGLPRLVIVVDEFAALLQEHPDLGQVFTDVAARGRALGMHLILGTQRASGVVRDALAANCPLRISLRVGDPADSRLMIGTTAAAEILGGAESRGLGFVRRPQDVEPRLLRVARADSLEVERVGVRWRDDLRPSSPWLPALPEVLPLAEAIADGPRIGDAGTGVLVLGRADDPERQAQPLELLRVGEERGLAVLGASGSGKTSVLRALASQAPHVVCTPHDPEGAWDLIDAWASGTTALPRLVLSDDVDLVTARLPVEYAQEFLRRWELIVRAGDRTTFVMTAARATGALARVMEALPRRALLRIPGRIEHLAAGGDAAGFLRDRPAGRARFDDREVQLVWSAEVPGEDDMHGGEREVSVLTTPNWVPADAECAVVTAHAPVVIARLRADHPQREIVPVGVVSTSDVSSRILVADAETWQRNATLWHRIRAEGEVVIRAENPHELRQLAGIRELPPYARPHAGRAWSLRGAPSITRVSVPAFEPASARPSKPGESTPRSRREFRRARAGEPS
ncbi:MAG: FtsK/SpoIIIE domain-containing protein [Candidatus Microbacterium colombiense]|nr:MAG: FtsK/SpoIIIE domain-containing protein [Microbacterium sp.]